MFSKKKKKLDYISGLLELQTIKQLRTCPIEKIYAIFLKKDTAKTFGYSPIVAFEYGTGNQTTIFQDTYIPSEIPNLNKNFGADAVVIVHNHPRVKDKIIKAYPSKNDIISTIQTGEAWQKEGCFLLDHIIINELDYYSFTENNLIKIVV